MPAVPILASLLALHLAQSQGKPVQPGPSITLAQYIESLHWDPAKSGTLIAVEADKLYINDEGPNDLSGFEQKMVKVGKLSAVAQAWAISLEDADLPNAYQALSADEKLIFLLATLDAADVRKLISTGLSPDDLNGEQRAALMSMIPKPLAYLEGEVHGQGFRGKGGPITLPDDELNQVKLQLRKGIDVMYGAVATQQGGRSFSSISSGSYRGPDGTPIVESNQMMGRMRRPEFVGRIVDSSEKKSEISWNDPRLAKEIELKSGSSVSDVVATVRQVTGIEVYADARIASLSLNSYGKSTSAGDLLRGLALVVGGVVRRVGPAYVLTAN